MIKTRKISCVAASVLVLLAAAVSCSKEGIGGGRSEESDGRITIVPKVDDVSPWGMKGTKGSTMSDTDPGLNEDYTIYTSAYYTDTEFPTTDGNFFTGVKFDKGASGWAPDPDAPIYWPADTGGNGIDFLAVATDTTAKGFGKKPDIVWAGQEGFLHGEKNVHGVRIRVPYSNDSTEVLYATAHRKCDDKRAVEMDFKHTQCCLEFHIHANLDSIIKLNNIYVKDAYSTGELTILTHPLESVTWNTDASEPHGVEVPGVRSTTGGTDVTKDKNLDYHVVMLPQERRDIVFSFRQVSADPTDLPHASSPTDPPGEGDIIWDAYSVEAVYTTTTEALKWEAGKKYIFDVTVKFGEIIIVPTVADWRDGEDFYQYVPV